MELRTEVGTVRAAIKRAGFAKSIVVTGNKWNQCSARVVAYQPGIDKFMRFLEVRYGQHDWSIRWSNILREKE